MAKKRHVKADEAAGDSWKAKLMAAQAVALAEFAAKALVVAEQLGIKDQPAGPFPLDETDRTALALLAPLSPGLKKKLVKAGSALTVAEVGGITMAIAEALIDAEGIKQLVLLTAAKKLAEWLKERLVAAGEAVGVGEAHNEVDQYMARLPPAKREVARALREVICKAVPDLEETIKWGHPCYVGAGNACSIVPYPNHVNLAFFRGAELVDEQGLLEGTGKGMRHVKVEAPEGIPGKAIGALVREAAKLDRTAVSGS